MDGETMGRRALALASLLTLTLGMPGLAHAGGFEFAAPGTRALGRGGAFMARADDPMALGYNPAALAFLPGYQLMLGSHLSFYDACVQRDGSYDDSGVSSSWAFESQFGAPDASDPNNWVNQPFPEVCREGYPGPSPQLVFSGHPLPWLGFAVGILAPSGVGNGRWGNADGTIEVDGRTLPTPTRYGLVEQDLLLFHPSIGVGVSPVDWISFGVTFQWGIGIVDFVNHTSAAAGAEDPADDVRTELNVTDPFVPAVIASVHLVPIDQLDVVFMARFSDSIDSSGTLRLTTGTYGTNMPGSLRPTTTTIEGTNLRAGQPWQFGLSVRYADRINERHRDPEQAEHVTGRIEDRMQNEVWDLELDVVYQLNSQVKDFVVTQPEGAAATVCEASGDPNNPCFSQFDAPLPRTLALPHGWNDQVSVRLGADWNVVPGMVALRAGAHFDTSGLNQRFQLQDFMPGMRLGLHAGATFRIERFDISVAYAHIFQFAETLEDPSYRLVAAQGMEGLCTGDQSYDPDRPVSDRGCYPLGYGAVVNGGTYSASYNVVSVQARYHFE
jgi:long-chain fatty acid transport protein